MKLHAVPGQRRRSSSCGQSAVEYLVVVSLLALALVVGPESALERVFRAFSDRYAQFSYAMSRP